MSDRDTTTSNMGPETGKSSNKAAGPQSVGEMCCSFAEMSGRMMAGGMPDCCRPDASEESGGSEADETASG